jgi:hypothetical protein
MKHTPDFINAKCATCGATPEKEKVALFKVEDGTWLCWHHMSESQRKRSDAKWLEQRKTEWESIKAKAKQKWN